MAREAAKKVPKVKKANNVKMGAKISNQINTNQQSNMALSAYCAITQTCSTVNINFA
jgi:hypothetical protein